MLLLVGAVTISANCLPMYLMEAKSTEPITSGRYLLYHSYYDALQMSSVVTGMIDSSRPRR